MFDWLTGTTRSADGQPVSNGDSESILEEPPETPAPKFVLRAFRSALFGTPPHPAQSASPSSRSRKAVTQDLLPKEITLPPEPLNPVQFEPIDGEGVTRKLDFEALVSPTKGILLTPGIGTTRRKNVTFRGISSDEKSKANDASRGSSLGGTLSEVSLSRSQADNSKENQPRQTSLNTALHKAQDGVAGGNVISSPSVGRSSKRLSRERENHRPVNVTEEEGNDLTVAADVTIDLSNPHSRSGQHWKAEFERYHKRSGREMRKIIKVSQNVKSFAVQKDSEAADLREKLQQELSKVAKMERKVTELATQLAATRTQDSKETPDQTKLVNDLARQTALAIRYKQRAENYKVALMKKSMSPALEINGFEDVIPQGTGVKSDRCISDSASRDHLSQNMASLRSELDRYRSSAEATEQKAAKLESQNLALQAEIDKLRQELKISESKRQAGGKFLQRREEVLGASNTDCDAQVLALSTENEALLRDVRRPNKNSPMSEPTISKDCGEISSNRTPQEKVGTGKTTCGQDRLKPRKHANDYDPESSTVDIWILEGQDITLPPEKPHKNRNSVEHSPKVLEEIPQNRVLADENRKPHRTPPNSILSLENPPLSKIQPAYESPLPSKSPSPRRLPTSGAKQKLAHRSTSNSPHPPMLNPASTPPKPLSSTEHPTQHVMSSDRQEKFKSSISSPAQTTSTLNGIPSVAPSLAPAGTETEGRKGSELPAPVDRKMAMRARMAERMAEKKKAREGKGIEA